MKIGGEEIANEDLAHISPLLFSHIIPNGTYRFREYDDNSLNPPE
jgi:hypothetical protein